MVRSRFGLKALGLCALVLGLMAVVTSAAQAEAGATWRVEGVNVTSLLPEVQVVEIEKLLGGDESKHAVLTLVTKGGTTVEFLCTSATTPGVRLGANGSVDLGKVTFHGCTTSLNGKVSAACLPKTAGVNDLITTENGVGLIILHEKEPLTLITPDPPSETLATIELGSECSIGTKVKVTGQLTLKDSNNAFTTEAKTHLILPGPLTHLLALGVVATLKGSAIIALAGAHNGLNWSGLPG